MSFWFKKNLQRFRNSCVGHGIATVNGQQSTDIKNKFKYDFCSKIIDQIKEREVIRLREEEMQEKERFQMLKNIELAKEADAKILVVKKDRI